MRSQRGPNQYNFRNDPWEARDHMNPPLGLAQNTVQLNESGKEWQRVSARLETNYKTDIFYKQQQFKVARQRAQEQMQIHQTTTNPYARRRAEDELHEMIQKLEALGEEIRKLKEQLQSEKRYFQNKIQRYGRIF